VTYSVQFQNGGFSLSDLIYISHSFVEFSKNCAGFSNGKYVGLHSGLSCVLNWCVFLCVTTRKPQNLDSANLYNIVDYVEYKQGQSLRFDRLIF
jgi:hypothetical protein